MPPKCQAWEPGQLVFPHPPIGGFSSQRICAIIQQYQTVFILNSDNHVVLGRGQSLPHALLRCFVLDDEYPFLPRRSGAEYRIGGDRSGSRKGRF
jgi:hypothetical protein